MLEERRLDLIMTKEDAINEMDCAVITKREEFLRQVGENAKDCLNILAESADRVFGDAKQCLDDFTREEQARLQRERG